MGTIRWTRSYAEHYVRTRYGLDETDDNQFEAAVNQVQGQSIETGARGPAPRNYEWMPDADLTRRCSSGGA